MTGKKCPQCGADVLLTHYQTYKEYIILDCPQCGGPLESVVQKETEVSK